MAFLHECSEVFFSTCKGLERCREVMKTRVGSQYMSDYMASWNEIFRQQSPEPKAADLLPATFMGQCASET